MISSPSVNPTWMQSLAFVMMNYGQSPAQVVLDAMKSDKSLEVTPNSVTLLPPPDELGIAASETKKKPKTARYGNKPQQVVQTMVLDIRVK